MSKKKQNSKLAKKKLAKKKNNLYKKKLSESDLFVSRIWRRSSSWLIDETIKNFFIIFWAMLYKRSTTYFVIVSVYLIITLVYYSICAYFRCSLGEKFTSIRMVMYKGATKVPYSYYILRMISLVTVCCLIPLIFGNEYDGSSKEIFSIKSLFLSYTSGYFLYSFMSFISYFFILFHRSRRSMLDRLFRVIYIQKISKDK